MHGRNYPERVSEGVLLEAMGFCWLARRNGSVEKSAAEVKNHDESGGCEDKVDGRTAGTGGGWSRTGDVETVLTEVELKVSAEACLI